MKTLYSKLKSLSGGPGSGPHKGGGSGSSDSPSEKKKGSTVKISNLPTDKHLNGRSGKIVEQHGDFYKVRVDGVKKPMLIHKNEME